MKVQTKLYLEEKQREELIKKAKEEKRSINNMIEVMIEYYLKEKK